MKIILAIAMVAVLFCPVRAGETIRLWDGNAPLARGEGSVDRPTMEVFLPEAGGPPSAAIVICPGGGYAALAMDKEGVRYAKFLNRLGIAGFVLTYRLGRDGYRHPAMLLDAGRAVRTVRFNARKFNIDPNRIGIMGSSAGGHLAATLMTKHAEANAHPVDEVDAVSSKPDFGILCYPVVSMRAEVTHAGSRRNLLGEAPSETLVDALSAELNVTNDTPKCFIWHTAADRGVSVANSLLLAEGLARNGIPFALHVYQNGGHGQGLHGKNPDAFLPWTDELRIWLKENGLSR